MFPGGEEALGLPAIVKYPLYDYETRVQKFPHRTTAMLSALLSHILVSEGTKLAFEKKILPRSLDILKCFSEGQGGQEMTFAEQVPAESEKDSGTARPGPNSVGPQVTPDKVKDTSNSKAGPEKNRGDFIESLQCKNEAILSLKINDDITVNHRLKSFNREKS